MQIEEAFRDLKNHRYGFSFSDCMSHVSYRLENLLLIGALATLAAWLAGKVAQLNGLHRHYQANTVRHRNVLSTFYLGCQVIASNGPPMKSTDFSQALRALREDQLIDSLVA